MGMAPSACHPSTEETEEALWLDGLSMSVSILETRPTPQGAPASETLKGKQASGHSSQGFLALRLLS